MIQLSRLNGDTFILNAMLVEQIQSLPDTTITLLSGKKLVVKEPKQKVIDDITAFYQKVGMQQSLKEVEKANE
ncbi:flagellar FlbD family protein [Ornithinibacillus halophilus]|uniref:Flagellar protein FlbD n=1 Tax=Ornithinibacillus halophilus TaxID=930117 RepID=A0A1M5CAD1_9BACI|nr:flagellar FlbD family protein [Ornithinibacillus halophilus]SHF51724.1 flagellar protein FlbD [Ornithinibacillus halophilus]